MIGVCLFDDVFVGKSAWISVNGEKAKRIQNINELSSSVLWVTNLNFLQYKKLNLFKSKNIVDEQFFRVKLTRLSSEVSINDPIDLLCSKLSYVLNNVLLINNTLFPKATTKPNDSYRYFISLNKMLFEAGFLPLCFSKNPQTPSKEDLYELKEAILEATHENQSMFGRTIVPNTKPYTFFFPKEPYFSYLFSLDYPVGGSNSWRKVLLEKKEVTVGVIDGIPIKETTDFVSKIEKLKETHCALFHLTVNSMNEDRSVFSSFGAGYTNGIRHWATIPEILELVKYASVTITSGYMTEKGLLDTSFLDKLQKSKASFSLSKGLFFENLFSAFSMTSRGKSTSTANPIGAYMRAYDRVFCGRVAKSFEDEGFMVGSYSSGSIVVYLNEHEIDKANELALSLSLIPLISNINYEELEDDN